MRGMLHIHKPRTERQIAKFREKVVQAKRPHEAATSMDLEHVIEMRSCLAAVRTQMQAMKDRKAFLMISRSDVSTDLK